MNQTALTFEASPFPGATRNKTKRAKRTEAKRTHRKRDLQQLAPSLPLNASDMHPTPSTNWFRMRHGAHFSQWCRGAVCVKLRTAEVGRCIEHRAEVYCPRSLDDRRKLKILKAFGLGGAAFVRHEACSTHYVLEVKKV